MKEISIQGMLGKEFPVADCLVTNFSDIFGLNFTFKYLFVEISLSIIFGRLFPQVFLVGDSFENCFVEIS